MIFAIFALSLELLVGTTGLVRLGHAAFFGIGAYATVLLSPQAAGASLAWLLPAGARRRGARRARRRRARLRTRGVYFIMVTLAFAQMAYFVFHDTKLGGGSDGIFLYVKPVLAIGGFTLLDLDRPRTFYYVTLACWSPSTRCSRSSAARASATRSPASASTSSACAPRASRPIRTSSRPSCSPARSPGWPASCSR